jgi:hypothetical protein
MGNTRFVKNVIYKRDGGPYDEESPEYDCIVPADTGDYAICDCWVCDELGNLHPGYNVSPVPHCKECLGGVVGVDLAAE